MTELDPDRLADILPRIDRLRANVTGVFLGKPEVIRLALVALLADGHLLLEDVPGVGKTLLAKAISKSLGCAFNRVQFTPDLLPGDLIGVGVFEAASNQFVFRPGPLFAQVVLADEVNRATPRTQSALLEAMSEKTVTVDGTTHPLGTPFLVLATQNPFEFEGTYPLPESQLDRFLLRVRVGYPDRASEREILAQHRLGEPVDELRPVLTPEEVVLLQRYTRHVRVAEPVVEYILDLVAATRSHPGVRLGASTRGAIAFYRAVQGHAVTHGRSYATPDDVKAMAGPVLAHRILTSGYDQGAPDAGPLVSEIVAQTRVPV